MICILKNNNSQKELSGILFFIFIKLRLTEHTKIRPICLGSRIKLYV